MSADATPVATETAPRRERLGFFALVGLVVLADQWSKHVVRAGLAHGESWPAGEPLLGLFRFTHVHNTGMAFGLFQGRGFLFLCIAAVVVTWLSLWQWRLPAGERGLRAILALMVAGALGNAIDRVHQGHVTDFFDFLVFPVFNIADSAISVGVALLAWQMWRAEIEEARREQAAAPAAGAERADALGGGAMDAPALGGDAFEAAEFSTASEPGER